MKPKWIIEHEIFTEFIDPFIVQLKKMGIEHKAMKFGESYESAANAYSNDDCVILYGSFQFATATKNKDWFPSVVDSFEKLNCSRYYPLFGSNLLNSDYTMLPFGELNRRKEWLFDNFGEYNQLFIRPDSGCKTFTGQLITGANWDRDVTRLGFYDVEPHEIVVVAKPIKLKREWRTVVVDKQIVASTQYRNVEDMTRIEGAPAEVLAYGQALLDGIVYNPSPAWTLDLCETECNTLRVLEVGTFSCAALYACDPEAVITAVSDVVEREYNQIVD